MAGGWEGVTFMGSLFDGSVGDAGFFPTQSRHDVHDVLVIVMQCVHQASGHDPCVSLCGCTTVLQMGAGKTKSLRPFAWGRIWPLSSYLVGKLLRQRNVGTGRSSLRTALQLLLSLPMCVFEIMGADRY